MSGRWELIAVWAELSATGCRLNADDDGLRRRLFAAGFRRGMSELCRARNEMPVHRVGTVSAWGPATNAVVEKLERNRLYKSRQKAEIETENK